MQLMPPYVFVKPGRVWLQRVEMNSFFLLENHGVTNVNWPAAAPTQIRAQSNTARAGSITVDVTQGDKDLPQFTVPTFLRETRNSLLALEDELVMVQVHTGPSGQPTQYSGANYGLGWVYAMRQPGTTPAVAIRDNSGEGMPVETEFPFASVLGPIPIDWTAALERRTTASTDAGRGAFTLPTLKDQNTNKQVLPGQVGMIVCDSAVGPALADIRYFENYLSGGLTAVAADPFNAGVGCNDVVGFGDKETHRFIVFAESEVGVAPAVAYTDDNGTTWTTTTLGAVVTDAANKGWIVDASRIYAVGGQAGSGKLWFSSDEGATWTETDTGLAQPLNDIEVLGTGRGYAVGASNTLEIINNFTSYSNGTGPAAGAGDDTLCVAIKPSSGTVFIGNDAGELYVSQDEAATWTAATTRIQGVTATSINKMQFDQTGEYGFMQVSTAAAQLLLRTTDGGNSWRQYDLGEPVSNIAKGNIWVYGPNDCIEVGAVSTTTVITEVTTDFDGKLQT